MKRAAIVGIAVFSAGLVAGIVLSDTFRPTAVAAAPEAAGPSQPHAAALVAGPGRVEPISEEIEVGAELAGRLAAVLVDEGAAVTRNQVLARLDSDDEAARVRSAEASLEVSRAELSRVVNGARSEERREVRAAVRQAEAEFEQAELEWRRRDELARDGVIAAEERDRAGRGLRVMRARLDEARERANTVDSAARDDERARAEAAVRLAQARLEEARAILEKTVIRAPGDGTVLRRYKEAGESVAPESRDSARVFTVADTRRLRVRVDVDETDIARVAVGQRAWVTADAYGDRRFEGTVVRVGGILGRKNIRTEEPTEKVDTKVLETLIELERDVRLPVGLRVDAFIGTRDGGVNAREPSHCEQQTGPGQDGGDKIDACQDRENAVDADEVQRDAEARRHDLRRGHGGALAEAVHERREQGIGFEVHAERGDADIRHHAVCGLREQEQHDDGVAEAGALGDRAVQRHARPPGRHDAAASSPLARRP